MREAAAAALEAGVEEDWGTRLREALAGRVGAGGVVVVVVVVVVERAAEVVDASVVVVEDVVD